MELELTKSVVIVERLEHVRLCVTVNPDDDRQKLWTKFRPEGNWEYDYIDDQGDYLYLGYYKFIHPNIR